MVRLTIDAPKALMNANHRKHWVTRAEETIIRPAAPLDLTKVALLTDPGFLDHAADLYTKVAAAAGTAEPIPRDAI